MTHHNGANSRIEATANNCSNQTLIMAPCIAGGWVAIDKAGIHEQGEELLPKRINSFHRLHREKIFPAVLISRKISFSIFPALIGSDKC